MTDKELREIITDRLIHEEYEEVLIPNGYADAFIGITNQEPKRAVYSKKVMVRILVDVENMSYEDATEFLEYNTWNAYVGDKTPIYIDTI